MSSFGFSLPAQSSTQRTPKHPPLTQSTQCADSGKTYICIAEAHSARLPLAQEQKLVVSIDVRYAPILLVPAAHLAGIIRFCNKATNSFLGSTRSHLQPITMKMYNPTCPLADRAPARLPNGESRTVQVTQFRAL